MLCYVLSVETLNNLCAEWFQKAYKVKDYKSKKCYYSGYYSLEFNKSVIFIRRYVFGYHPSEREFSIRVIRVEG